MDNDRVAGSTKDFAGKVESTVGNVAGDAKTQMEGLARQATGTAQDLYGQTKDMARDAADTAANYARNVYETGGDASQALAERVKANPLGSVVVAGAIGFALALLLMRPPNRPPQRWR
jgi:uncharacterized protein YjbJ (UPF0337 family)